MINSEKKYIPSAFGPLAGRAGQRRMGKKGGVQNEEYELTIGIRGVEEVVERGVDICDLPMLLLLLFSYVLTMRRCFPRAIDYELRNKPSDCQAFHTAPLNPS